MGKDACRRPARGRRAARNALAAFALAPMLVGLPMGAARADLVYAGTCVVQMTLNFASAITTSVGAVAVTSFNGSGTCATNSDLLGTPTRTITITGTDTSSVGHITTCEAIVVDGNYDAVFTPALNAPTNSAGEWKFAGSVGGGALLMSGVNPIFRGIGALVLKPLTAVLPTPSMTPHSQIYTAAGCATGGSIDPIDFVGVLTFGDP